MLVGSFVSPVHLCLNLSQGSSYLVKGTQQILQGYLLCCCRGPGIPKTTQCHTSGVTFTHLPVLLLYGWVAGKDCLCSAGTWVANCSYSIMPLGLKQFLASFISHSGPMPAEAAPREETASGREQKGARWDLGQEKECGHTKEVDGEVNTMTGTLIPAKNHLPKLSRYLTKSSTSLQWLLAPFSTLEFTE